VSIDAGMGALSASLRRRSQGQIVNAAAGKKAFGVMPPLRFLIHDYGSAVRYHGASRRPR
jgi:hypothetical protein